MSPLGTSSARCAVLSEAAWRPSGPDGSTSFAFSVTITPSTKAIVASTPSAPAVPICAGRLTTRRRGSFPRSPEAADEADQCALIATRRTPPITIITQ